MRISLMALALGAALSFASIDCSRAVAHPLKSSVKMRRKPTQLQPRGLSVLNQSLVTDAARKSFECSMFSDDGSKGPLRAGSCQYMYQGMIVSLETKTSPPELTGSVFIAPGNSWDLSCRYDEISQAHVCVAKNQCLEMYFGLANMVWFYMNSNLPGQTEFSYRTTISKERTILPYGNDSALSYDLLLMEMVVSDTLWVREKSLSTGEKFDRKCDTKGFDYVAASINAINLNFIVRAYDR